MLTSLGIIWIVGLLFGGILQKLKLPSLMGLIVAGMVIGPQVLGMLDDTILAMSPQLRQLALVIILTRAGLSLNLKDLKKVGRPAVLLCFLPATFELVGITLFAPSILGITTLEAAIMGSVLAAVSPAVVVPRMIRMMEEGYGVGKSIPQMILAGASIDDVYVIVLFTFFTAIATGANTSVISLVAVPIEIAVGIIIGGIVGVSLLLLWKWIPMRHTVKVMVLLSTSFLLLALEVWIEAYVPMSALLAIMSMGLMIYQKNQEVATALSVRYQKLWVAAEVMLFVLVGASVNLDYMENAGLQSVLVVVVGLLLRMIGVWCCMLGTSLKHKERGFCMVSYTPKATVQAAIGGIPLALGLACGDIVLTVAVLAILITAPFAAISMDQLYQKWTSKE